MRKIIESFFFFIPFWNKSMRKLNCLMINECDNMSKKKEGESTYVKKQSK